MTDQNHSDRDHAQFAPSGAERWTACHLSFHLSQGIDSGKSSSYAQEGTECHEAAAAILMGTPWDEATKDLSDDQMDIVEEYTDYVFGLIDKLSERYDDNVKVWIEERVFSSFSTEYHGTADTAIFAGRTVEIADLKAGFLPVYPRYEDGKLNKQLGSYAILTLDTHKLWKKVDKVRMTIIQPRVHEGPLTITASIEELREFRREMEGHIEAILAGDKSAAAGKHCKFCPVKGRCPILREDAVRKAKIAFDDIKPARLYDPEDLIDILNEAEIIEQHIAGVRAFVKRELEKGRLQGMGWKLVPKRAVSKWIDWEKTVKEKELRGWKPEEVFNMRPKSPKHIAKLLGVPVTDLAKHYVKESSGTTLARDGDQREEVKHDPFADEG